MLDDDQGFILSGSDQADVVKGLRVDRLYTGLVALSRNVTQEATEDYPMASGVAAGDQRRCTFDLASCALPLTSLAACWPSPLTSPTACWPSSFTVCTESVADSLTDWTAS